MRGTRARPRHRRPARRGAGLAAACIVLVAAGCASHRAPSGFLAEARDTGRDPFGGWIEVTVPEGTDGERRVQGELLAVSADSLWVLGAEGGAALATGSILRGQVTRYDSGAGDAGVATLLGTVSTLSNGFFLVFTAPMWVIGGTVVTGRQSQVPVEDLPPLRWTDLAAHARFPQGVPPGVTLSGLKPKPHAEPTSDVP